MYYFSGDGERGVGGRDGGVGGCVPGFGEGWRLHVVGCRSLTLLVRG